MIDYKAYLIIIAGFSVSLLLSSVIIRSSLPRFHRKEKEKQEKIAHSSTSWYKDLGFWIGFFETLIIFVFVAHKEYSGLAIIFAAKEFVRKEEIRKAPVYYLLGTLINFGVALLLAEISFHLISLIQIHRLFG